MDDFHDDVNDLEAQFDAVANQTTPKSNVVNMAAKKQEKSNSKGKTTNKELFANAIAWINGKSHPFPEPFPHHFKVRQRPDGLPVFFLVSPDNVYHRMELEGLQKLYMQAVNNIIKQYGDVFDVYRFLPPALKQFMSFWLYCTTTDTAPLADVRTLSEPGACFKRLDFDPTQGECPVWDELMGNVISNRETLEAWIGALFHPDVMLQQYVWLYGDGINGKGTIMGFLHQLLGDASCPLETDYRKINQFTTSVLIGKRLAVADDCEHPSFVKSGWFKAASGGAKVRIEEKGKPPVDAALTCLYAFTSNQAPAIDTQRSNLRRAIFVEFKPSDEVTLIPDLPAKLWAERAAIVGRCMARFQDLWEPAYARLRVDEVANRSLAEANESDLEELFLRYWDCTGDCKSLDVVDLLERERRWDTRRISEFFKFCERRFKVRKIRVRRDGIQITVLQGMSFRSDKSTGNSDVKF